LSMNDVVTSVKPVLHRQDHWSLVKRGLWSCSNDHFERPLTLTDTGVELGGGHVFTDDWRGVLGGKPVVVPAKIDQTNFCHFLTGSPPVSN